MGSGVFRAGWCVLVLSVGLSSCSSTTEGWIQVTQHRAEICRRIGANITDTNQRIAEYRREGLIGPRLSVLDQPELLPKGRVYRKMVSSLSDRDLVREINAKFSPSYTYEYAERLHRRGNDEDALRFSYMGNLPLSPVAFKTDGRSLSYKNEYLKEYGGYPPSQCLAYVLCSSEGVEAPVFLADCKDLRDS